MPKIINYSIWLWNTCLKLQSSFNEAPDWRYLICEVIWGKIYSIKCLSLDKIIGFSDYFPFCYFTTNFCDTYIYANV